MNRRSFLKGAAGLAGVSLIGMTGCEDPAHEVLDTNLSPQDSDSSSDTVTDDRNPTRANSTMFSPASIGNVQLKNRLIRSATEEAYCDNGLPTPAYTKVFTDLAAGGMGGILCGIAMVAKEESVPFELYACEDSHIEGFAQVREAVRQADPDCKLFAQVGHQGYRYISAEFDNRIGPSNVGWPGDKYPTRALEIHEIEHIVDLFAQSIRRFKEAGWDGAEIHGGHAYLLSSFLSPYTNKRTDRYGGSVAGRCQIIREIVEQSRALVGDDFPIFIKFNSDDRGGSEPKDLTGGIDQNIFVETANELTKMEIDAIDVTGNNASQFGVNDLEEQSYFKEAAVALDVDIPIILTGGNRNADSLNQLLDTREVDFIGISRPLIREPDLANKWLQGEKNGADCISCNLCVNMDNLISGMKCHQLG